MNPIGKIRKIAEGIRLVPMPYTADRIIEAVEELEKERKKVDIIIVGGAVQSVRKDVGIELNIFDFDDVDHVGEYHYSADENVQEIDYGKLKENIEKGRA